MIGCIAFKEHDKPACRIDCAQGKRLTPSNRSSGLRNEKDFRSVRSGKLARRTREHSSRMTGSLDKSAALTNRRRRTKRGSWLQSMQLLAFRLSFSFARNNRAPKESRRRGGKGQSSKRGELFSLRLSGCTSAKFAPHDLSLRRFRDGVATCCPVDPGQDRTRLCFGPAHAFGRHRTAVLITAAWSARILFPYLIVWPAEGMGAVRYTGRPARGITPVPSPRGRMVPALHGSGIVAFDIPLQQTAAARISPPLSAY
jgi:hypothetical protein